MVQPPLEVFRQGVGGAVAAGRVLLQALERDRFQVAVGVRIERPGPSRLALPHLDQRLHDRAALKRWPAGQEFVEDRAQE